MNNQAKIRKITGASLFIIIILFVSLFIGTNGAAFAVTVDSDVYADLMQMTIDGKKFDVADYPANDNGETRMLSFIEYGYSFDETARDKFALFAYVYNPKKNVVATSGQNKIQLANAYDKSGNATEYTKYRLQLVSASADGLFLKYKIAESAEIVKRLTNRDARRYDVSGIELTTRGDYNATEYAVAKTLTFSGYMPGFGENQSTENTLKCAEKGMTETVQLELNHTYYRTGHSDKGANHFNQINTAYFSIPGKYMNDNIVIKAITAEWWEYVTQWALVTSNQDFYNLARQYTGTWLGDTCNKNIPFYVYNGVKYQHLGSGLASRDTWYYDWSFNRGRDYLNDSNPLAVERYLSTEWAPILPYVFYSPSVGTNTILDLIYKEPAGKVNKSVVSDWIYNYRNDTGHGYIDCNGRQISNDLFMDHIDADRAANGIQRGYNKKKIDFNDTFDVKSFDSNHKAIEKLFAFGWKYKLAETSESYQNVQPIYYLKNTDFDGNIDDVAKRLLIDKNSLYNVRSFYNAETAKGNTVVLFRFANSDYRSMPACRNGNPEEGKEDCYVATQTVFMDFDIIEFDFQKGEEVFTVPVIANPIDIINDYDSPGIGMKKLPGYDLLILIVAIVLTVIFTILLFVLFEKLIVKQFNSAFAKIGMSALCLIVAFAVSAAIVFLCASAVYGAVYKVDFNSAAKAFWKYVISKK